MNNKIDAPPTNRREVDVVTRQQSTTHYNDPEWKFFDTARIHVSGGMGGNGAVAFRREKGDALGGPCGGRGGSGGSVFLVCDESINTLAPLRHQSVHIRATKGLNGVGKGKDGAQGENIYIRVPRGTIIRDLLTQKVAGELKINGEKLLVARGGRGGRGNAAFKTARLTAPKLAEKGEPGAARWLTIELRLVADVGFLGKPNAGKSTLLSAASAARPKIADYPFTTIFPNLGVCDIGEDGAGLVLCDIPGLIEGAAEGTGLGLAFLRHVRRCKVLLHIVDGNAEDPIGDFIAINKELKAYDNEILAQKPQVVVLNKIDIPDVQEKQEELLMKLQQIAGHGRVFAISAATTLRVKELMGRLKKFVSAQPDVDMENPAEIDLSISALEMDSDDYEIASDPAYPGQWRIKGVYIEQVAKMTHWEYPEAVERFGRQLQALGIESELIRRGAIQGDLVMVDVFDFYFSPDMTNPYIPDHLLARDAYFEAQRELDAEVTRGGPEKTTKSAEWKGRYDFMGDDVEELLGFNEDDEWELLDNEQELDEYDHMLPGEEIWTS